MPINFETLEKLSQNDDKLVELNFWNQHIGDEGVEELVAALNGNTSLGLLALGGNDIGTKGAAAIGIAIVRNPSIYQVGLWRNKIGDDGTEQIAHDLDGNNISEVNRELINERLNRNKKCCDECHRAAKDGRMSEVQLAISSGVSLLSTFGKNGDTLLHKAGHSGSVELIGWLLQQGLSEIRKNKKKQRPCDIPLFNVVSKISNATAMLDKHCFDIKLLEKLLNEISNSLEMCRTSAGTHLVEVERTFSRLLLQAYMRSGDMDNAILHYIDSFYNLSNEVHLEVAEYLYTNIKREDVDLEQNRQLLFCIFALLQQSWRLTGAQRLIPQIICAIRNPDEEINTLGQTRDSVIGVEMVIPMDDIAECILRTMETVPLPSEEKVVWNAIVQDLSLLPPEKLFGLCQLYPLSDELKKLVGTTSVTTFYHVLENQKAYPISCSECLDNIFVVQKFLEKQELTEQYEQNTSVTQTIIETHKMLASFVYDRRMKIVEPMEIDNPSETTADHSPKDHSSFFSQSTVEVDDNNISCENSHEEVAPRCRPN